MRRAPVVFPILLVLSSLVLAQPLWAVTYAYIPSYGNDKVIRVATSTGDFTSATITEDDSCGPYGAAVAPNGEFVLVTCEKNGALVVLYDVDFSADSPAVPADQIFTNDAAQSLRGVAFDALGRYAYIANDKGLVVNGSIIKVSASSLADSTDIEEITVGRGPLGVATIYDEDNEIVKIYVANHLDGSVSVLRDNGSTITARTISNVGTHPAGVAAGFNGQSIYVANYNNGLAGSVTIINTTLDALAQSLSVGNGAWGVAVGGEGLHLYVTNSESNSVTVINTILLSAYGTYAVGTNPYGIAAPKYGRFAYAINTPGIIAISKVNVSGTTVTVGPIAQNADHPLQAPLSLGAFIGGTPPSAPSDLAAVVRSYDTIDLSWNDNSTDELGFKIERREQGDTAYEVIAEVDADAVSFTDDAGLSGGNTYEYRMRAFNEVAVSDYDTMDSEAAVTTEEGGFSWCFIGALIR